MASNGKGFLSGVRKALGFTPRVAAATPNRVDNLASNIRTTLNRKKIFLDLLKPSSISEAENFQRRLNQYYTSNDLKSELLELRNLHNKAREVDPQLAGEIHTYRESIERVLRSRRNMANILSKQGRPSPFYGAKKGLHNLATLQTTSTTVPTAAPKEFVPRDEALFQSLNRYRNATRRGYRLTNRNKNFLKYVKDELALIETMERTKEQRNNLRKRYTQRLQPILNEINTQERALAEEARLNAELEASGLLQTINTTSSNAAEEESIQTALDDIIKRAVNNPKILDNSNHNRNTRILLSKAITLYEKKKNQRLYDKIALLISMKQASGSGSSTKPAGGKRKTRRNRA